MQSPYEVHFMNKVRICIAALLSLGAYAITLQAQTKPLFEDRVHALMSRSEFAHTSFGVEVYSLDRKKILYQFNPDKLMVPGSTTKLLTEGTVLTLLGADYRFHTPVYRI